MTQDIDINEILLVDDEEDIRDVLSIALKDLGYRVTLAENGQKAIKAFETRPFSMVLTDIKMPVMDGIELLKKVKHLSPGTEIIMITGHGDMDLAIESFRNQAVEFITKPVDVNTLETALNRAKAKIEMKRRLADYTTHLERQVLEKTEELKSVREISSIMDTLPMVIFCVDRELRITSCNGLFKEQFGDRPGDLCHRVCKGKEIPCEDCPALKSFISKQPEQAEILYTTRDLREVSFLAWASPVVEPDDTVSEVMIMAIDVSRVVDIEDHLKSLGLMIGSVSHGIKGLLTGLDGGLYVLDSALKKQDQDQAKEGLEMMKLMTSKIRKMILDILFYTKKREFKKEPLAAIPFAREIIQTMKPKIETAHLSLTLRLPPEEKDIEFMADPEPLSSAIINIFDNAVDACVEQKKRQPSNQDHGITFSVGQKNGQIEFAISDTGTGMTAQEIKQAFTLFHSGKGKKGTGLGLFIADKVIAQHQGTIDVTSEPGKGSSFSIRLPLT
ncbi:MAG: response regulator [Desulfobacteraceae bacterium]|nr:response regulator [Desulfobacteraceae bacterium]